MITFFTGTAKSLPELADFYKQCGYGGTFDGADDVYYAIENNIIIAVVRIAVENNVLVLRGMQVLPMLRGKQIGPKLLSYMFDNRPESDQPYFCLPHDHLVRFYGAAGFTLVGKTTQSEITIPEFLIQRQLKYVAKGLSIELMVRSR